MIGSQKDVKKRPYGRLEGLKLKIIIWRMLLKNRKMLGIGKVLSMVLIMMLCLTGCGTLEKRYGSPESLKTNLAKNPECAWLIPIETPDVVLDLLDKGYTDKVPNYQKIMEFKQRVEAVDSGWLDNCVNNL
tara:strand:- start:317 stop:709 length:393 start_codon:yes stop_codon:yes gene_type:complete